METFVIIPAHNEEKHIQEVIQKTKNYAKNIVVVDDGSKDNTYLIAKGEEVTVLKHVINLGKGLALKTGCDYAYLNGAKKIIVMDADGQHNPNKIHEFINKLDEHDLIFGYREKPKNMPFMLKFGNWVLNKSSQILFNIKVRDTQCGYRAFTAEAYKKIRWKSRGYSMESEMIANAGRAKIKCTQIPIETIYKDKYKGTTVLDGMKIALNMFMWKLGKIK